MADYTIRVESDSNTAHKDIDSIDRKLKNLQAPIKVNIQFPSFSETVKGIQDVGKALQATYGIARNVVPALMDIESIGASLGNTFQTTAKAALLLSQASPGKTLAVSLQGAILASDTLVSSIARVGFTVFGLTQSVNVLKAAYGGMFDETIGREIRLQQVMLQTQTTIAATNKVLRNGVELTNPLDSVLALKRPIQKAIEEIRVESLQIAGTTSEAIIQVFGTVSSQIGQVGGSIEDAKKLALSFSAALGTIGMSDPSLAVQEVGSMLRGDIDNNSILARSLGITNKEIQKAKQTGDLVDFITKKLAAFTAGQKIQAQGFAGITSNIQEIQQEMGRALGAPMLQPLLDGLSEVYRRMSLVVKPTMQIADGLGRAGAALGQGLIGGAMAAPSLQNFDDGSQKKMFESVNRATADLFLLVQQEIDKLRPSLAKFTDEMVKAFVMVGSGLKELFEGFTDFKFEQIKILANSFTNLAGVLNSTVIPAVSTLLTLYGKLIEQPLFQYLSQLTAQFAVMERIGVNGMIRIGMTIPSVYNSLMQLKRGFDTVISAVAAGFTSVGTWISTAIAAISQAISFTLSKIIDLGVTIVATMLRLGAIIAQTIDTVFVNLAAFFARVFPQFPKLEILILEVAATFRAIGRGANQAAADVEIQAIKMALALEKLKVSAVDVGNAARKGAEGVGNSIKGLAGTVGGFIGAQLLGLVKFLGIMLLVQVAVTVAVDLFGRFQRKNDEIASQTRTELALKRLATVYKDVGDSSAYAARKAKEMEETVVNNRWDELTKKIQETSKAINDLNYDIATRGINSWQELGLAILSAFTPNADWATMQADLMKQLVEDKGKSQEEQNRIANQKDQKDQEASIQILGQKKSDISKQLRDLERAHENSMFQLRQQALQKTSEIISLEGDIRIQAAERLNAKLLEGQEGVRRSVTQGINEYLATKMKGEKTIEDNRRQMQIEINSMEKSILDYRFETEKNIAAVRKLVGNYEKEVSDYKVKQAEMEGKAREAGGSTGNSTGSSSSNPISAPGVKSGFLVGSSGKSSGPHLDVRGPDKQKVIEEALAIVLSLQKSGVEYMELPNLAKLEPANKNILNVTDQKELRRRLAVEQGAHDSTRNRAPGASRNAIDISLPAGTLIPMPASAARWTEGGGGYVAQSLNTGNQFLHGLPSSTATGMTMGPSTNSDRSVGQAATLGGKSVTWNGQAWIGADGKTQGPPSGTKPTIAPPTAPVIPDLASLQNAQASAQQKITRSMEAQMKRIDDLKTQLIKAQTGEAFDNILKNALPIQGTEQYIVELKNANIALDNLKKTRGQAYDPKQLELVVDGSQRLAALDKARADTLASIATKRNEKGGELTETEKAALVKKTNDWYNEQNSILATNLVKRKEILQVTSQYARLEKVQSDIRDVGFNLEKSKISTAIKLRGLRLNPEDVRGQRLLGAEETISNYRLDYGKANPGMSSSKIDEEIVGFAAETRSAAIALAELDVALKKQTDIWARGAEIAKEFSGGLRNIAQSLISGGSVSEALRSSAQSLADRVMGQSMDMVFKPIENELTNTFAQFFGASMDPQTTATNANTLALTALTQAITFSTGNSAGSSVFGTAPGKGGSIWGDLLKTVVGGVTGSLGGDLGNFSSAFGATGMSDVVSTAFGSGLNLMGSARNGGILTPYGMKSLDSYRIGGVAKGPSTGYLAELHGTEAVVPLPNGRSLPVELRGGGNGTAKALNDSLSNSERNYNRDASQELTRSLGAMEQNYNRDTSQVLAQSLDAMEQNYQASVTGANGPTTIRYERVGSGDLPFVTEEQFQRGIAQSAEEVRRQAKRDADQQWRKSLRNDTRIPGLR